MQYSTYMHETKLVPYVVQTHYRLIDFLVTARTVSKSLWWRLCSPCLHWFSCTRVGICCSSARCMAVVYNNVSRDSLQKSLERWRPKSEVKVVSCVRLFVTPLAYTVHGILQARILEWVAFPLSRGSSQCRDQTQVSCIARRFFTSWGLHADSFPPYSFPPGKPKNTGVGSLSLLQRIFPNLPLFWSSLTAH